MFLIRSENAPQNQEKLTYRCNRCGTKAERLYKIRREATGLR
jgi:DNA-directed RNA polymerase subunit RPC12/RpoP